MHIHDSKSNNNNSNSNNKSKKPSIKNTKDNDAKAASVMSNLSSYSLIDEDHIDDQETINVGNLIIDLESDLEKEKNEQANASTSTCSTTTNNSSAPSSSSSSFGAKASSSTSATILNAPTTPTGKLNQRTFGKQPNVSINNNANCTTTSSFNSSNNGSSTGGEDTSNSSHLMTTRTVHERGELKMRITRDTKPGKSEHKIVTSPNQKSPTSSSSNNNNTSHLNSCDDINSLESTSKPSQSSSISSTKECGTSTSIGTITEPDCLGPCEPGTSVTLEGIVWQETEGGILVVNVTWRGKTYVGALLDCTKHDWAPPRLCDSPASDMDSKSHKGVRAKRIVTRSNGVGLDEKNLLQTTGKLRNGKGRRILTSNEIASCERNKRHRESEKQNEFVSAQSEPSASISNIASISNSETACVPMNVDTIPESNNESLSKSNISSDKTGPDSPMLIGCSEPNCSKKYRNINGLMYHQTHAHGAESDPNSAQENSCSSSIKDKTPITTSKEDQMEPGNAPLLASSDNTDPQSPTLEESKDDVKLLASPQSSKKIGSSKFVSDMSPSIKPSAPLTLPVAPNQEAKSSSIMKTFETDRRNSSGSNHSISMDHGRRSPGAPKQTSDLGPGSSSINHSSSKINPSSSKMSNPAPLPATIEEGMKPSGTSTGPPPAPHQTNCFFNSNFVPSTAFNPYGFPPFYRPPLPMYDPIPTSSPNALLRFMSNMRVPVPPESPSRLLSPSMSKNLPFPPFKVDAVSMPVPNPQMVNAPLPNMPPLTNPSLPGGSPHLRIPSQGDPMLAPTSQPPFPPTLGLNPTSGLPGPMNPLGPIGPLMPSLVDDQLAKQFPRRFN